MEWATTQESRVHFGPASHCEQVLTADHQLMLQLWIISPWKNFSSCIQKDQDAINLIVWAKGSTSSISEDSQIRMFIRFALLSAVVSSAHSVLLPSHLDENKQQAKKDSRSQCLLQNAAWNEKKGTGLELQICRTS